MQAQPTQDTSTAKACSGFFAIVIIGASAGHGPWQSHAPRVLCLKQRTARHARVGIEQRCMCKVPGKFYGPPHALIAVSGSASASRLQGTV